MNFNIEGSYITKVIRDMVLSQDWRKALEVLDTFDGMDIDMKYDLMKGKKIFTGRNELEVEDSEDYTDFKEKYEFIYNKVFYKNGKFYKPYRIVSSWCYLDAIRSSEETYKKLLVKGVDCDELISAHINSKEENPISVRNKLSNDEFWRTRFYSEDLFKDYFVSYKRSHYICEEHQVDLPPWVSTKELTFERCLPNIVDLQEFGSEQLLEGPLRHTLYYRSIKAKKVDINEMVLDEENKLIEKRESEYQEKLLRIRDLIFKQLEKYPEESRWQKLHDKKGNYIATVAKPPLDAWADANYMYGDHHSWLPVSDANMKMPCDNRFHTDWMISGTKADGSFIDLEEDYLNQAIVQKAAYQYQFHEFSLDDKCVKLAGKGFHSGRFVWFDSGVKLKPGDILGVMNASVEFSEAYLKVTSKGPSAVICVMGNKVAHLCKLAREDNSIIMMVPDARKIYKTGMKMVVDAETCTITHEGDINE